MFPAPVDFKFEKDSYKFVGLLTIIAGTGFIYTCVRLVSKVTSNTSFSETSYVNLDEAYTILFDVEMNSC